MNRKIEFKIGTVTGLVNEEVRLDCGVPICGGGKELRPHEKLKKGERVLVALIPGKGPQIIPLDRLVYLFPAEADAVASGLELAAVHGIDGPGGDVPWSRLDEIATEIAQSAIVAMGD